MSGDEIIKLKAEIYDIAIEIESKTNEIRNLQAQSQQKRVEINNLITNKPVEKAHE